MTAQKCEIARCEKIRNTVITKVLAGSSCKECGRYGYESQSTVYLYLITNKNLAQHKIGFGIVGDTQNEGASRLEEYCGQGWSVYGIWHATSKREIYRREKEIFKRVEALANKSTDLISDPMGAWVDGWAESIDAAAISAPEIAKIIEEELKGVQ